MTRWKKGDLLTWVSEVEDWGVETVRERDPEAWNGWAAAGREIVPEPGDTGLIVDELQDYWKIVFLFRQREHILVRSNEGTMKRRKR